MKSRIAKAKTTAKTRTRTRTRTRTKAALLKSTLSKTAPKGDASESYDASLLGADDSTRLTLVELKLPVTAAAPQNAVQAKYHSVLAMEAARKMGRSRQKLRTGQEVCHHLKMMLASDPSPRESVLRKEAACAEPQFRLGF
ncbi:MAG: hypothetical protein HOM44_16215 [Gammaproteobacteria bacterium]|nr:hypothetical protein [Gammaproteobacteria bacterium]